MLAPRYERFCLAVDRTLMRLGKWLRAMGFDTEVYEGIDDEANAHRARKEGRTLLTRVRISRFSDASSVVGISGDRLDDQLKEAFEKLDIRPEVIELFSRCLACNRELVPARKEEVEAQIPDYVLRTQKEFKRCPGCGRVYWRGTHPERMKRRLSSLGLYTQ